MEDHPPADSGLFFGKRANPNMNNLLFGRRSSLDPRKVVQATDEFCKNAVTACSNWADRMNEYRH